MFHTCLYEFDGKWLRPGMMLLIIEDSCSVSLFLSNTSMHCENSPSSREHYCLRGIIPLPTATYFGRLKKCGKILWNLKRLIIVMLRRLVTEVQSIEQDFLYFTEFKYDTRFRNVQLFPVRNIFPTNVVMVTLTSQRESNTAVLKSFRGGKDIDMYLFIDKVLLCYSSMCSFQFLWC